MEKCISLINKQLATIQQQIFYLLGTRQQPFTNNYFTYLAAGGNYLCPGVQYMSHS